MAATPREVVIAWTDEVWNKGRVDLVPGLVADPCPRHDPGKFEMMTLAHNLERINGARARFPGIHFTNEDLVVDGDRVAARWTMRYTDPASGEARVVTGVEMFRVAEGKIVETWNSAAGNAAWG